MQKLKANKFNLEVQRLRPVTPQGVPHGVMSEVSLGSWRLPPGTMVMPLHWAANHQPRAWPQPEQFNPNRFLDKDGGLISEIDIYPFQVIYMDKGLR